MKTVDVKDVEPLTNQAEAIQTQKTDAEEAESRVKRGRAKSDNGLTLAQNLFLHVLPPGSDKRGMLKGDMQEELLKLGYRTTKSNPKVIIGQALHGLKKAGKVEKVSHGFWRLTKEATKERSKVRKRERDRQRRAKKKSEKVESEEKAEVVSV